MIEGYIGEKNIFGLLSAIHGAMNLKNYSFVGCAEEDFSAFFRTRQFNLVNVAPDKSFAVMPFLDELTKSAKDAGFIDTVINKGGKLLGYCTALGALKTVFAVHNVKVKSRTALLLGGEYLSTAVEFLSQSGAAQIYIFSRDTRYNIPRDKIEKYKDTAIKYIDLSEVYKVSADIIMDCSFTSRFSAFQTEPQCENPTSTDDQTCALNPTSTENLKPTKDLQKIDLGKLFEGVKPRGFRLKGYKNHGAERRTRAEFVFDFSLASLKSMLVQSALMRGIKSCNALSMKVYECIASEKLLSFEIDGKTAERAFKTAYLNQTNIVLIGMAGAGKTRLGRLIAEKTGKPFIDTDEVLTNITNHTPSELFNSLGETKFRAIETQAVKQAATSTGAVISTGGGAVLNQTNAEFLKANGKLYFIERAPYKLAKKDRPLYAKKGAVYEIYKKRLPCYVKLADKRISNDGALEDAANSVISDFFENICY